MTPQAAERIAQTILTTAGPYAQALHARSKETGLPAAELIRRDGHPKTWGRPRTVEVTIGGAVLTGGFAYDVPCSHCDGRVPVIFAAHEGKPECRCDECARKASAEHDGAQRAEHDAFQARLRRTGLSRQPEIVSTLGLEPGKRVRLEDGRAWQDALDACRSMADHVRRDKDGSGALLMLSGPNGTGKSTSAAAAVWVAGGHFLGRERWTRLRRYESSEIDDFIDLPGILVVDEVCTVNPRGTLDNNYDMTIMADLIRGRHARQKHSIVTTNATQEEWLGAYGSLASAIWTRAEGLSGRVACGGWVECQPRAR